MLQRHNPHPPRQAADKRQKGGPSWKKGVRFLKPVHTWRCKRGRKTEAENWTPFFADPEADTLKQGNQGFIFRVRLRAGLAMYPPPPSKGPQGEVSTT